MALCPLRIVEPEDGRLSLHLGESVSPIAQLQRNTWESSFFARQQARASIDFEALPDGGNGVLERAVGSLVSEADRQGYILSEIRLDARKIAALSMLQDAGFRLVESRVRLTRQVEKASVHESSPAAGHVRWASEADHDTLIELTVDGFARNDAFYSRFKNPSYYSPEQAERYYSAWASHHLEGDDYRWAVLDVDGRARGYLLYSRDGVHQSGAPRYRGMLAAVAAGFRGVNALMALRAFIYRSIPDDPFYWDAFSQLSNLSLITSMVRSGNRLESIEHILYRRTPLRSEYRAAERRRPATAGPHPLGPGTGSLTSS